jgi:hypothetical protein
MATFRKVLNIVKNNSFQPDLIQIKVKELIDQINQEHIKKYLNKWFMFIGHYFVDEDWFLELLLDRKLIEKKLLIRTIYKHLHYNYFEDNIIQTFLRVCVIDDFNNHKYLDNMNLYYDTYHDICINRQDRLYGNYKYLYVNYLHFMSKYIFDKYPGKTIEVLNEIKQKYKFNTTVYYLIKLLDLSFDEKLNHLQQILDVYLENVYDKNVLTNYVILSIYNLTKSLLNRTDENNRKIFVNIAQKYNIYNDFMKSQIDKCCSNEYITTSTHFDNNNNILKIIIKTQTELDNEDKKSKQITENNVKIILPNLIKSVDIYFEHKLIDSTDSEYIDIWKELISNNDKSVTKYIPLSYYYTKDNNSTTRFIPL